MCVCVYVCACVCGGGGGTSDGVLVVTYVRVCKEDIDKCLSLDCTILDLDCSIL